MIKTKNIGIFRKEFSNFCHLSKTVNHHIDFLFFSYIDKLKIE